MHAMSDRYPDVLYMWRRVFFCTAVQRLSLRARGVSLLCGWCALLRPRPRALSNLVVERWDYEIFGSWFVCHDSLVSCLVLHYCCLVVWLVVGGGDLAGCGCKEGCLLNQRRKSPGFCDRVGTLKLTKVTAMTPKRVRQARNGILKEGGGGGLRLTPRSNISSWTIDLRAEVRAWTRWRASDVAFSVLCGGLLLFCFVLCGGQANVCVP